MATRFAAFVALAGVVTLATPQRASHKDVGRRLRDVWALGG